MYTLKSIARRVSMLGTALAIVVGTFLLPVSLTYADALNPLTQRSLTLTSSSPGWEFTDGSGNGTYAPPNSGANGQKVGNQFAFKVSTDSHSTNTVKAFTFQYCTRSAGYCTAPGNDGVDGTSHLRLGDTSSTADLAVATSSPSEISSGTYTSLFDTTASDANGGSNVGTYTPSSEAYTGLSGVPAEDDSQGNFVVETLDAGSGTWSYSSGWAMAASNVETAAGAGNIASGDKTGKDNFITLTNSTGGLTLHPTGAVRVIFFATDGNYVTNPGTGSFFVKINDYNSDSTIDDTTLLDGGVTVANVVNQSIEIQTKVLETMDFSVGTVDPDTLDDTALSASSLNNHTSISHGQCDRILPGLTEDTGDATANTLQLGDTTAENSLSTSATYSTHSYWRLSSNSSAGATVYYSGNTLSNTEGDKIKAIGTTSHAPSRGSPQFGLALDNATTGVGAVDYSSENNLGGNVGKGAFENAPDIALTGVDSSVATDITAGSYTDYHDPQLAPMVATTGYADGSGSINGGAGQYGAVSTQFAFDPNSNQVPTPLATEASQVVDCVTGKVRYIANIAATTPAGIYTTKINYIAAPQY